MRSSSFFSIVLAFVYSTLFLFVSPPLPQVYGAEPAVAQAVQALRLAAGEGMRTTVSPLTSFVTFLTTQKDRPIPLSVSAFANPEDRALTFLDAYGLAFGIQERMQALVSKVDGPDELGMEHVRFQQVYQGVPVTGGEMTVHLRGAQVVAVHAKTWPDIGKMNIAPTVSTDQALASVQELLTKQLGVSDSQLSAPRLEIFNRGFLEGTSQPTRLAWFVEATKIDLRELIWVDAETGHILLHFSQLTETLTRQIYDAGETATLPGTLIRSEGGAATGNTDADAAYDYSGDTYNYYASQHGRDSFDNAGGAIQSTIRYFQNGTCPNAFWNGSQMVYCDGLSQADDVDAHELTHAVTERTAHLFYYMQSGALNESFSDIFGETVDLTNGHGNDTPGVRWQIGEDIPAASGLPIPLRYMMDPTLRHHPGKVSDPQFFCSSQSPPLDRGGVHENSGVPNHAYALMVDGGNYNGFTITGIGLTKAAKIEYRALTVYLLSGSDFLDEYNALKQSCADLIGTVGITTADCTQVGNALDAVEMADPWPCFSGQPRTPALCPERQTPTDLFFDNFENGFTNWQMQTLTNTNLWGAANGFTTSGMSSLLGDDIDGRADSAALMNLDVPITARGVRMQFNHSYGFEASSTSTYDGAVLEYSMDGGGTWFDAGTLISAGAKYNGIIASGSGNPLGGRRAFTRDSFGYTASQLNLSRLVGQQVRFRFRLGTDQSVGDYGWFIDDVRIYRCPTMATQFLPLQFEIANYGVGAGGWLVERHPRTVADVNGDGLADIVGFGEAGAYVSLSTGAGFMPPQLWINNYGATAGGWQVDQHPRTVADVNGDGLADIVGFGEAGAYVSLSTGAGFTPPQLWINNYGVAAGGWLVERHPRAVADVNGDGLADIVGFGDAGTYVSLSTGAGFLPAQLWINNYGATAGGWQVSRHPRTLADVNGDGLADIVGFGEAGAYVSLSTGAGFLPAQLWINNYGASAGGWQVSRHPRALADVNGDGLADIVGFGEAGAYVSLSTGAGFLPAQLWINNYGASAGGWQVDQHPRTVADVNGDGWADIIGFGFIGTYLSLSGS